MNRRSGDTFRKICRALAEASEGKRVAYVSQVQNASRYYFDMAAGIVTSCLSSEVMVLSSDRYIIFPSGGRIQFVLASDIENKRRGVVLSEYHDD